MESILILGEVLKELLVSKTGCCSVILLLAESRAEVERSCQSERMHETTALLRRTPSTPTLPGPDQEQRSAGAQGLAHTHAVPAVPLVASEALRSRHAANAHCGARWGVSRSAREASIRSRCIVQLQRSRLGRQREAAAERVPCCACPASKHSG